MPGPATGATVAGGNAVACCVAEGVERQFNERMVRRDLERFRRRGPDRTTRLILEGLDERTTQGATLLDIGGGIGVIPCELLTRGLARATLVEAAWAYIGQGRAEAERRGFGGHIRYVHGDVVRLAHRLEPADIVTLDRVICCYPDVELLVAASASRCRRWYALSFPRDRWYVRAIVAVQNALRRLSRNPFRTYVHSGGRVEALVRAAGLVRRVSRGTFVWQAALYERVAAD